MHISIRMCKNTFFIGKGLKLIWVSIMGLFFIRSFEVANECLIL